MTVLGTPVPPENIVDVKIVGDSIEMPDSEVSMADLLRGVCRWIRGLKKECMKNSCGFNAISDESADTASASAVRLCPLPLIRPAKLDADLEWARILGSESLFPKAPQELSARFGASSNRSCACPASPAATLAPSDFVTRSGSAVCNLVGR